MLHMIVVHPTIKIMTMTTTNLKHKQIVHRVFRGYILDPMLCSAGTDTSRHYYVYQ